jgi:hypothetical protein
MKSPEEIRNAIEAAQMAVQCAITDADPSLFQRRSEDLAKVHAKQISAATASVEYARRELVRREDVLIAVEERCEHETKVLLDRHLNADVYKQQAHDQIEELHKRLKEHQAINVVARIAALKAQIEQLEAEQKGGIA